MTTPDARGAADQQVAWCIREFEGGWADDARDRGGATLMGMTLTGWLEYSGERITAAVLAKKTPGELLTAHIDLAARRSRFDRITDWRVRLVAVDWAIISSRYTVCPYLQRAAGTPADGNFGPATERAVNGDDGLRLATALLAARQQFHIADVRQHPSQRVFLTTWMDRCTALLRTISARDPLPPGAVSA